MATPIIYSESTDPVLDAQRPGRQPLHLQGRAPRAAAAGSSRDSQFDGWVTNIKYGLGTFNNKVVDHSWIYPNYGHGFLDPLMGIVLWARRGDRRAGAHPPATRGRGRAAHAGRLPRRSGSSFAFARQQGAELHAAADHAAVRRISRGRGGPLGDESVALGAVRAAAHRRRVRRGGRRAQRLGRLGLRPARARSRASRSGAPAGTSPRTQRPGAEVLRRVQRERCPTTSGATSGRGNDRLSLFIDRRHSSSRRSTRPRSRTSAPCRRSPSSCAARSGSRWRPSCRPSIRGDGSATSSPDGARVVLEVPS